MTRARAALLARREELLRRADAQRDEMVREFDGIGQTFRGAESVLRFTDTLVGRIPQLAVGAAVATLLVGPARISRWAAGAWMVWRAVRSLTASK